jgi:hypothetical protein
MATKKQIELRIRHRLGIDTEFMLRALMYVYQCQTINEQHFGDTLENNRMGFRRGDAKLLTAIAKHYKKFGRISDKMVEILRSKMPSYHRQVFDKGIKDGLYVRASYKEWNEVPLFKVLASKAGLN